MSFRGRAGLAGIAAAAAALALLPAGAGAATITPSTANDEFTLPNESCSVREAVESANEDGDFGGCDTGAEVVGDYGDDTIVLTAIGYTLSREGFDETNVNGDLDVEGANGTLTIRSNVVDGSGIVSGVDERVLDLTQATSDLTIEDLVIGGGESGGVGGNIRAETAGNDLTLTDSRVINGFAAAGGGGIRIAGAGSDLLVDRSQLATNVAHRGGGIMIGSEASVEVRDSRVADNDAIAPGAGFDAEGGGIFHTGGSLLIEDSEISGNDATAADPAGGWAKGGGIFASPSGGFTITGTLIAGNRAFSNGAFGELQVGGGLHAVSLDAGGTVTNSTFYDNEAGNNVLDSAGGGAVYADVPSVNDVELSHVTFLDNEATSAGGADDVEGAVDGLVSVADSVFDLAGNPCEGPVVSDGFNVGPDDDSTDCGFGPTDSAAATPTGLAAGPPQDNGGPTDTIALAAGGRAVDFIPALECDVTEDQRGYPRPLPDGGACDAGAYELHACEGVPFNGPVFEECPPVQPPAQQQPPQQQQSQPGESCGGRAATQAGTSGPDTLTGTAGADVIAAGDGKDTVRGLGGEDVLCGGRGRDLLVGGGGKDRLLGQGGRDRLRGGGGRDLCKGGKGRDAASACERERSI